MPSCSSLESSWIPWVQTDLSFLRLCLRKWPPFAVLNFSLLLRLCCSLSLSSYLLRVCNAHSLLQVLHGLPSNTFHTPWLSLSLKSIPANSTHQESEVLPSLHYRIRRYNSMWNKTIIKLNVHTIPMSLNLSCHSPWQEHPLLSPYAIKVQIIL